MSYPKPLIPKRSPASLSLFFLARPYSQEKWQSQVTFGKNLKWCFVHAIYYNSPIPMGFVLLCPHSELRLLFQHKFVIPYPWAEEYKPWAHQNSQRQLEQWILKHNHPSWIAILQLASFLMCNCWIGQGERRNWKLCWPSLGAPVWSYPIQ